MIFDVVATGSSVNMGARSIPFVIDKKTWSTVGVSASQVTKVYSFGKYQQDIPITFEHIATTLKTSLQTLLLTTIGEGQLVLVTPDSFDDLGCSCTTATQFSFLKNTFRATSNRAVGKWDITFTIRKYS